MLYAMICYNDEAMINSWSKEEDDAVMARLGAVQDKLMAQRRLGPAVRLKPTRTASTLHKTHNPPLVLDGPYAETKEQLLGFYIIDCATHEEAVETARELAAANPGGAYEIRPVSVFLPGGPVS